MHQNNSAVSDKLHSACLRHKLRPRPSVARVEGSWQIKTCLGHWNLEFGYCPSTWLRVVSPSTSLRTVSLSNGLSNHLLFVIWSLELFIFKVPMFRYRVRLFMYLWDTTLVSDLSRPDTAKVDLQFIIFLINRPGHIRIDGNRCFGKSFLYNSASHLLSCSNRNR